MPRRKKAPPKLKRAKRGRPPLNADGSKPSDLRIRLPRSITTRLAVVCAGQKVKLPEYIRAMLDETLPQVEGAPPPPKPPPLPPLPPLDPAEVLRLAIEFAEDPSDHEDPPFYYDPASGTYR